jgi:hypothetical protein
MKKPNFKIYLTISDTLTPINQMTGLERGIFPNYTHNSTQRIIFSKLRQETHMESYAKHHINLIKLYSELKIQTNLSENHIDILNKLTKTDLQINRAGYYNHTRHFLKLKEENTSNLGIKPPKQENLEFLIELTDKKIILE